MHQWDEKIDLYHVLKRRYDLFLNTDVDGFVKDIPEENYIVIQTPQIDDEKESIVWTLHFCFLFH